MTANSAEQFPLHLYDIDISDLLSGWEMDLDLPKSAILSECAEFESLQEPDLIRAIVQSNYSRAYALLRKLDHTLAPADAMAACLCALARSPKLMNTLLDHCPPIPEFQFAGAGTAASLLVVAARHDKDKMLDLLLHRGADPNGGPTPLTAQSPLEEAFCFHSYDCVRRLLACPDLKEVPLTEKMLLTWGSLSAGDPDLSPYAAQDPRLLWCCQLLAERITGQPYDLWDPLPILPQLGLGHTLHHRNWELAAKLCRAYGPAETDCSAVLNFYEENAELFLLVGDSGFLSTLQSRQIAFLTDFLARCPQLLAAPQLRTAVATAALALSEPDQAFQSIVMQMPEGPVLLPCMPQVGRSENVNAGFPWITSDSPIQILFHRWDERLGSKLIPIMDRTTPCRESLSSDDMALLLKRVHFVGKPASNQLSPLAERALHCAPLSMLPELLQPTGLLGMEAPSLLLDTCQILPASRRNRILPCIRRDEAYSL